MSSVTALFVVQRALEAGAHGRQLLVAFGPGFSAYFAVVELQPAEVRPRAIRRSPARGIEKVARPQWRAKAGPTRLRRQFVTKCCFDSAGLSHGRARQHALIVRVQIRELPGAWV